MMPSKVVIKSRNSDRKSCPTLEIAFYIWSSNDGVEPADLRDGFEGEIPHKRGDEYLHLQDSKSPPDARAWSL